jgi:RNA-binding protein 39
MKEKFQEARKRYGYAEKEMEEAKREDHTIIVYCLPLKAKEKHIWKFFYDGGCGRVRDIRIIRDNRSGKSKGVAYVEFYTSDAVERALLMAEQSFELNGRCFNSLKVQHSQAEKNRAAAAAKYAVR